MTRLTPERRLVAGIALVPEGRRLFPSLTVEENLLVGSYHARPGPWTIERVYELFGWMRERRTSAPPSCPAASSRRSRSAGRWWPTRGCCCSTSCPWAWRRWSSGGSTRLLPELLRAGLTVLLVEQDVSQALRVASRIQCLLEGRTTLEGRPAQFTAEQIEAAYFGLADDGERPS